MVVFLVDFLVVFFVVVVVVVEFTEYERFD